MSGSAGDEKTLVERLALQAGTVTPARIFIGRVGTAYRTGTALTLRADHAAARDAVLSELDVSPDAVAALTGGRGAVVAASTAGSRTAFVQRPDLGRRLDEASVTAVGALRQKVDLQIVLGDGLSSRALSEQAPALLDALSAGATERGWSTGDLVVVSNCRVGIVNDIGRLTGAAVVVLLIGERPGLATASSLSAYLAYRPRPGHDDSRRNLVSNIHANGLAPTMAADRILRLADAMRVLQVSGVAIKESEALPGGPAYGHLSHGDAGSVADLSVPFEHEAT